MSVELPGLTVEVVAPPAQLPPPLRTAIVLRDVEGLSTQEAAEIADIGQAAFKSRLHQARLRARAAIGDGALVTSGG